jgi:predicted nucleic acid-binding protein
VPGYLLDSNHVQAIFNKKPGVMAKLASLPRDTQLRVSAITLGEIEAGHRMTRSTNQQRRDEYTAFVNEMFLPNVITISASTRLCYGEVVARIWERHPPTRGVRTEVHLVNLGVDINDLWIFATAWEHGLILVTQDKMTCIQAAVPEVEMECWV